MTCPRCNGTIVREDDPWDGPRLVCLQCGRSPRIKPIGFWYAREAELRLKKQEGKVYD